MDMEDGQRTPAVVRGARLSTSEWSRQRDLNPQPSDYKSRLPHAALSSTGRPCADSCSIESLGVRSETAGDLVSRLVREHRVDLNDLPRQLRAIGQQSRSVMAAGGGGRW